MGVVIPLAALAVITGILLLLLLVTTTVPPERVLDGYVLFVGGLVMLGLVHATRTAAAGDDESAFERALRPRRRSPLRPRDLEKLEREVVLASGSAFDVHFRLRPLLRQIAAHRLASRRGADLDAGSDETRAALGEELWEILRPDRPPPHNRYGPGLPLGRVRAAVDAIERI